LAGLPNRVHSMRSRASCGFFVWLDEPAGYLRSAEQLLRRREPIDPLGHHAQV
jgi:hypothetical protein